MKTHRDISFMRPDSSAYETSCPLFTTLYDLTYDHAPKIAVELGIQSGSCSRTIAAAMYDANGGSCDGCEIYGYDRRQHLRWVGDWMDRDLEEIGKMYQIFDLWGEEGYDQWTRGRILDYIFVDTDPHSYEQTMNWLKTWIYQLLVAEGIAVWHDTHEKSPVRAALNDFVAAHLDSYSIEYIPVQFGLGILRKVDM